MRNYQINDVWRFYSTAFPNEWYTIKVTDLFPVRGKVIESNHHIVKVGDTQSILSKNWTSLSENWTLVSKSNNFKSLYEKLSS